ncbi:unnamed protein product [Caenorhabditis auriculariae]|uniref:Uncharacterized protein n=1 Tax=Caenorhabditis auriculariae TaxID=2777116 RepID=A0A8S1GMF9_9PELO|nr:unnamed protein product [Caenorhabditis auriculariae]
MRRRVSGLKNNSLKVSWMINRSKSLITTPVELKKSIVRKSPLRLKDVFFPLTLRYQCPSRSDLYVGFGSLNQNLAPGSPDASNMSDFLSPKELSNAFRQAFAAQLYQIAAEGVMPSAHGRLSKLLCSCYDKNAEVVDIYGCDVSKQSPEPPHPEEPLVQLPEDDKMLAAVNLYDSSSASPRRTNNHRTIIEDVTDDPQYSSYGNENEEPQEGALVEYNRLDKTSAAPQVCEATVAVNRSVQQRIRPFHKMTSASRELKMIDMELDDVLEGAPCHDPHANCRGWRQHPWRSDGEDVRSSLPGVVTQEAGSEMYGEVVISGQGNSQKTSSTGRLIGRIAAREHAADHHQAPRGLGLSSRCNNRISKTHMLKEAKDAADRKSIDT